MPTKLTDAQRVRAARELPPEGGWPMKPIRFAYVAVGQEFYCGPSGTVIFRKASEDYATTEEAPGRKYSFELGRKVYPREHMADTPELPEMDVTEEPSRKVNWITQPCPGCGARAGEGCIDVLGYRSGLTHEVRKLRAPLTGPAMEAMVRACAEAVWQMYYEPHNLTWDARKEQTFEAMAALVVETQGTLLDRVRDLEAAAGGGESAEFLRAMERHAAVEPKGASK